MIEHSSSSNNAAGKGRARSNSNCSRTEKVIEKRSTKAAASGKTRRSVQKVTYNSDGEEDDDDDEDSISSNNEDDASDDDNATEDNNYNEIATDNENYWNDVEDHNSNGTIQQQQQLFDTPTKKFLAAASGSGDRKRSTRPSRLSKSMAVQKIAIQLID